MKTVSFGKRVLALLTAAILVFSCVTAVYAAGSVDTFNGDSSNGYVTIELGCFGGGEFSYNVDGEVGTTGSSYYAKGLRVGGICTATAIPTEDHPFLYWQDQFCNRVYSFENTITFTMTSSVSFKAIFSNAGDNEHVVQYLNYGGNTLLVDTLVQKGVKPAVPAAPVVPGFSFVGWSLTTDQVAAMDDDVVVVTPRFNVDPVTYTVTLTNDAYATGAGVYSNYETVNLKADAKNGAGESFSYWKDSSGEIISYDRNYSFRINYDVTLTAVFGETVTPQPIVRTSSIVRDADNGQLTVFAERSVPEGYTVLAHGILISTRATIKDTQMRVGNGNALPTAPVRKVYGTSNENCGTFSVTKTYLTSSSTVITRPFAICQDASGAMVIAYGDILRTPFAA